MSKYKGKHGGKKGKKIRQGSPPPLFGQCPKENIFFTGWHPLVLRLCLPKISSDSVFVKDTLARSLLPVETGAPLFLGV